MEKGTSFDVRKTDGTVQKVHWVSGICPFLYEAKTWDEKALTQIIKTTIGKSKLDNKIHFLQVDEIPEQLMLWLKNYGENINKNPLLESAEKWAMLNWIINKEAQPIMSKVEGNFKIYMDPECIDMISDHAVQIKVYNLLCDTDNKFR